MKPPRLLFYLKWLRTAVAVIGLSAVMLSTGGGCANHTDGRSASDTIVDGQADITVEAMEWADSVTRSMSLQKRIGQLFMPAVFTNSNPYTLKTIADYAERLGVGGIIFLKGNVEAAREIADTLHALASVGMFVAIDAEKGLAMRLEDAPTFLWNSEIGSAADEVALYDYGEELARECRLTGINVVLGPVLDVTDTLAQTLPRESFRSFGDDAGRAGRLGVAYARGLEDGGVLSVAKHFPGHGSAAGDSHLRMVKVSKSRRRMMEHDLYPFRLYISSGLSCIMAGHIYAPALDSLPRPASFSPAVLTGLLRDELGFRGLVMTDALNMKGAKGYTVVDAIKAGADIVLAPPHTEDAMVEVREAVDSGVLTEADINARCRRILFYKYLKGIAGASSAPKGLPPANLNQSVDSILKQLRM